jgi:Ca2+-binding RTX toxin-like protein
MATITVSVEATAGALLDGAPDDPWLGNASGENFTGVSSTSFTVPHPEFGREYTFSGTGFAFEPDETATAGLLFSITVQTLGSGALIATFVSDTGISLVQLSEAMEALEHTGDESLLDAILDPFAFNFAGNVGADEFFGAGQADLLSGGDGDDTLGGEAGNDSILGAEGNDRLQGNQGSDTLRGGLGDDELRGGQDNDVVYSGQGNDQVFGALGNDELRGGLGNDTISAGQGNDSLFGGADNDLLQGRLGNDTVTGGAGEDMFWFNSAGAADADLVTDFQSGDEIALDLSVFTAQVFGLNILYDSASGQLSYDADGAGAGAAVLIATLMGAPALVADEIAPA